MNSYFTIHQNRINWLVKQISDSHLAPGSKLLDVGCYPDYLSPRLSSQQLDIYGIASSHEKLNSKKIAVLNLDTDTFPWQDQTFDYIVCSEVFEHLLNPSMMLAEICRVLKPHGTLLLTTPNATRLQNKIKIITGKNIYFSLEQLLNTNLKDGSIYHRHNREYTKTELIQLATLSKLSILSTGFFTSYTPFRKGKKESLKTKLFSLANYLFTTIFNSTADTIYLKCTV